VQHPFGVRVQKPERHVVKQRHGLTHRTRAVLREILLKRAALEVLHHVVRRVGVPTHVEQLHHVAIGRQKCQLFDFVRQQRPVEPPSMGVKLDGHLAPGGSVDGNPHFAIGSGA